MRLGSNRLVLAYGAGKLGEWKSPDDVLSKRDPEYMQDQAHRSRIGSAAEKEITEIIQSSRLHGEPVCSLEFSACGELCLTADASGLVVIWRTRRGKGSVSYWLVVGSLRHEEKPAAVSYASAEVCTTNTTLELLRRQVSL